MFRLGYALSLAFLLATTGCDDDGGGDTTGATEGDTTGDPVETTGSTGMQPAGCDQVFNAIVTDIDETLTTADSEWTMQIADGTYDPMARAGSTELVQSYADRGYLVLYLTARPETVVLEGTGEGARDATQRWLEEHDFPVGPRTQLVLAPSFVVGDTARDYKAQAIMDLQAQGWMFDYAYGNATSDIGGYDGAGIPKDVTFIIGEEAGVEGTQAIAGEGWTEHIQSHLPGVAELCTPAE